MPGPTTGIGPALREARETLGKRLEEASRDTRIKPDYLDALERESFEELGGDVYVRGTLRSYSAYLGLDPDKVVTAYGSAAQAAPELADDVQESPPHVQSRPIRKLHRSPNWKLAFLVAAVLLVAFAAAGLLSGNQATPEATAAATSPPAQETPLQDTGLVYVYLEATKKVQGRVIADGNELFIGELKPGHPQQFTASTLARVWLDRGGLVQVTVNGHDLGEPGVPERAFVASFTPQDYRESPSPSA